VNPTRVSVGLQKHVLLAEDDEDLRRLFADALCADGIEVTECPNGLLLVEMLVSRLESAERPFDLVVSDVRMPGVSGLSVLEGLSECDELRGQPIILITAFCEPALHECAHRLGAVSLLEKPIEPDVLLRAVREAIDGRESNFSFE